MESHYRQFKRKFVGTTKATNNCPLPPPRHRPITQAVGSRHRRYSLRPVTRPSFSASPSASLPTHAPVEVFRAWRQQSFAAVPDHVPWTTYYVASPRPTVKQNAVV